MANVNRIIGEATHSITVPVLATKVEIGDLIYLNAAGTSAVPASSVSWSLLGKKDADETAAVNRSKFLGVSESAALAATTSGNIRVATEGNFRIPSSGVTVAAPIGSYIAPVSGVGTLSFSNQLILAGGTASSSGSIGRLLEGVPAGLAAGTSLKVRLHGVTSYAVDRSI